MNQAYSPPLKLWLPALVVLAFLLPSLLIYVHTRDSRIAEFEALTLEHVRVDLSLLQSQLQRELTRQDLDEARVTLSGYGLRQGVAVLAVVDGDGRVLLANHRDLTDTAAASSLVDFNIGRFQQVLHDGHALIEWSPGHLHLHAYYPLTLPSRSQALRAGKSGLLYLDYHLSHGRALIAHDFHNEMLRNGLGLLLTLLVLIGALHWLVTRPVQQLQAVADRISEGDLDARAVIHGSGELAHLGRDLNRMNENLSASIVSLQEREEQLETTLNAIGDGVIVTDMRGCITRMNPIAEQMTGWSASDAHGHYLTDVFRIVNAITRSPAENPVERVIREGVITGLANHTALLARNGREYQIADSAAPIRLPDGEVLGVILVFQDVTEDYRIRAELEQSHDQLRRFTQALPDIAFILDEDGVYIDIFGTHKALLYTDAEKLRGRSLQTILPPAAAQPIMETIQATLRQNQPQKLEYPLQLPVGERWFEGRTAVLRPSGELPGQVAWVAIDITERKQAEAQIEQLAYYDALTGLPNRRLLLERLGRELLLARRHRHIGAVLFMDLDYFKTLNDALGHQTGDLLLQRLGERLRDSLREEDTVARLGGDEFIVLLPDLARNTEEAANQAGLVASKLHNAICEPYDLDGHEYLTSVSLGISLFPTDDESADDILRQADAAMYLSKSAGRNTISFYRGDLQQAADQRLRLENDLRNALAHESFHLNYQPQFDAAGGIIGAEVLVRWQDPVRGNVPPIQFIPVMEETGTILALGEWVLRTACRQFQRWREAYPDGVPMLSVNISSRQFRMAGFCSQIREALDETGMAGDNLILEITEGIVVENVDDAITKMRELQGLGVQFSIDDFGTGYSSLAYLQRLPLDELKIDRSFVNDVATNPGDAAITQTIIAMAENLGLRVVAEGVETREQLDFLTRHGCQSFQGYFFSRPLDSEGMSRLLAS